MRFVAVLTANAGVLMNLRDDGLGDLERLEGRSEVREFRRFVDVSIYSSAGVRQLSTPEGAPLGNMVLRSASQDPAVAEALALVGTSEMTWARVYDVIEFLGGDKTIAALGLASAREVQRVRQTANHYRHLGKPKPRPLPSNPPTLPEAITFATELLKRWIAGRL